MLKRYITELVTLLILLINILFSEISDVQEKTMKYDKEHTCYICNAIFTRIKSLTEHCLSAHDVDKPYQCSECKETFSSKRTLRFHITNTHEKSKYLPMLNFITIGTCVKKLH